MLLHVAALSTNNAYNPVVTSAGELFVLDLDTHETATVDPMTGVVTDLAPYASVAGIAQAFRGYDPLTNRVYQLGASVYAFDGTSGELLFSSVEAVQHGGLYNPGVNGTGQILGIAARRERHPGRAARPDDRGRHRFRARLCQRWARSRDVRRRPVREPHVPGRERERPHD